VTVVDSLDGYRARAADAPRYLYTDVGGVDIEQLP